MSQDAMDADYTIEVGQAMMGTDIVVAPPQQSPTMVMQPIFDDDLAFAGAERLSQYCTVRGYQVALLVKEIASLMMELKSPLTVLKTALMFSKICVACSVTLSPISAPVCDLCLCPIYPER